MDKAKFVISKKKILEKFDEVSKHCDIVSYSSKTNPLVTGILEDVCECMFSIHMKNELKNVKDVGRVMFLGQGWSSPDVEELLELGIRWFVVDNDPDLDVFLRVLESWSKSEGNDEKVNLLLRMRLKENTLRTEKYFVFGFNSDRLNELIKKVRGHERIEKLGVHFHRKTQNMAEWSLLQEFKDNIDEGNLSKLNVVCIGGGLPSEYANTNVDVMESVWKKVDEFGEWLRKHEIKMMIEPGRFIAAPAGKLVTKILRIYGNNIVVNASVYGGDLDALIVPVKLKVEGELKDKGEGVRAYVIKGITPCSMDLFRYRVYLPDMKVKEGGELVFLNAGAYNFSSDFCDLERIKSEIVD